MDVENFLYPKKSSKPLKWTPEKGFESNSIEIPSRAKKGNEFKLFPMMSFPDATNYCYQQAFTIIFHNPAEIPTIFHERFSINHNKDFSFIIKIKSVKFDNYLRHFSPHHRKCYFENEKKLKFFNIYTKFHCEFECNVNQTLRNCGCVHIAMPRENSTEICHLDELDCVKMQKESDSMGENQSVLPCDCYPSCNDVKYSLKMDFKELPEDASERFDE